MSWNISETSLQQSPLPTGSGFWHLESPQCAVIVMPQPHLNLPSSRTPVHNQNNKIDKESKYSDTAWYSTKRWGHIRSSMLDGPGLQLAVFILTVLTCANTLSASFCCMLRLCLICRLVQGFSSVELPRCTTQLSNSAHGTENQGIKQTQTEPFNRVSKRCQEALQRNLCWFLISCGTYHENHIKKKPTH